MNHSWRAVSTRRGRTLSATGPGTSALNSCMPPMPSSGRMAMVNRMIPMPPTHWVKERHSNRARGQLSSPVTTVEPVVVKPETDSNTASMTPR